MSAREVECHFCGTLNIAGVTESEWRPCANCGKQVYFKVASPAPARTEPAAAPPVPMVAPRLERKGLYVLAVWLLITASLPVLSWPDKGNLSYKFFDPAPLIRASLEPDRAMIAAVYPVVAAVLLLVLIYLAPNWVCAPGLLVLGGLQPAVLTALSGPLAATGGLLGLETVWDGLILGGLALAFVAARAQSRAPSSVMLACAAAAGGVAVLVWLLLPREPAGNDGWFGLICKDASARFPLARGVLRNWEFPQGTHPLWYVWWNLILLDWVVFPLCCLLLPFVGQRRPGWADTAYYLLAGVLVAQLLLSVTSPLFEVLQAREQQSTQQGMDRLLGAVNALHWFFPPLLLLAIALSGLSDLFVTALTPLVPAPATPSTEAKARQKAAQQKAKEEHRRYRESLPFWAREFQLPVTVRVIIVILVVLGLIAYLWYSDMKKW